MSENKDKEQPKIPESYIVIRFTAPGAIFFEMEQENVFPLQVVAVCEYLKDQALRSLEEQRQEVLSRERERQLLIPKPGIALPQ